MKEKEPVAVNDVDISIPLSYQRELTAAIRSVNEMEVVKMAERILETERLGGTVYTCGNGGSAATASHMVCDLVKNTGLNLKVYCINDNMPIFSAYGNDDSYSVVFSYQLAKWMRPEDTLIAISTSGNSPNIVDAVKVGYESRAHVFLLTGGNLYSDAIMSMNLVDEQPKGSVLFVHSDNIGVVEDCHLAINHMLTEILRELA